MKELPVFKSAAGRDSVIAAYERALAHWPLPCEKFRVATSVGETAVLAFGPGKAGPRDPCPGRAGNER
jgi:hypothetical protein